MCMKTRLPVAGPSQEGRLVLPAATASPGGIAVTPVAGAPVRALIRAAAIGPAVVPGEGTGIVVPVRTAAVFIPSGTPVLRMVDEAWKENLRELDELKHSVQNASYEQKVGIPRNNQIKNSDDQVFK